MSHQHLKHWITGLTISLLSSSAWADGSVEIAVSLSPAGSFTAQSAQVKGQAEKIGADSYSARDVTLEVSTLKTGIELRDKHMRDKYFEAQKYPKATLKSGKGQDGRFEGALEVHGKTTKVSGDYTVSGHDVVGKFKTKLSDYGISEPRYLGVGVEDEVEVTVKLPVVAAKETAPKPAPRQPK